MTDTSEVVVRLNQQQLELLDGTVAKLGASGRADVLLRALREYVEAKAKANAPGPAS